ncbi:MAG: metal-dependent transcriptional regulator [Chloroflexi bacterium]|nr:MAG: metal-dependent transcriptional regulator [Chloroflexota bacterium]
MVADQVRSSRHTRAQEDYLKALYHLEGDRWPVPTSELAQRLRISAASVSEMVTRLSERGLVSHDRYRGQQLTAEGRVLALELVRHHRLLEMFLVRVLGYGLDEVHEEAERLEHVISERMEERIFELLGRPELDPHGHAIPSREGAVRQVSNRRLSDCRAGEAVVVRAVSDDDSDRLRELQRRRLMPGTRLEVVAGTEYESPIEARMGRKRISVPLGLAREVFVEEAGR